MKGAHIQTHAHIILRIFLLKTRSEGDKSKIENRIFSSGDFTICQYPLPPLSLLVTNLSDPLPLAQWRHFWMAPNVSKKAELTPRASTVEFIFYQLYLWKVGGTETSSYPKRSTNFGVPQSRSVDVLHSPDMDSYTYKYRSPWMIY